MFTGASGVTSLELRDDRCGGPGMFFLAFCDLFGYLKILASLMRITVWRLYIPLSDISGIYIHIISSSIFASW